MPAAHGCNVCRHTKTVNLITASGIETIACPCQSDGPKPAWYWRSFYGEWAEPGSDDWKQDRDDRFGVGAPTLVGGA